ncbi:conserved hypothetical protein [Chloroherpeton thalassium ATCC 35110]|uniref:Lipoprotein n=1 Tax=Chloroherpeton thalassium (strain ATCC 35110 / GB-78) TaxID=517418 RepID=B3QWL5_CHLT3|nr:hypothetical protein [Chloroherpeton thalassium]ACF14775.1 conserved hypothetical protein [Chloroherpeton thalassium ATCC 35110]
MNKNIVKLIFLTSVLFLFIGGCTKELEEKVAELEKEKQELALEAEAKEKYVEEVVGAINEIQSNLDTIRVRESIISKASTGIEKRGVSEAEAIKRTILSDISDIDSYLQENKKKVSSLQKKMQQYRYRVSSLEKMVENLQNTISQKEMEIAYLKEEISSLNVKVAALETTIRQKERVIQQKEEEINEVYYIIGDWEQLKEKGVIEDQGGFLWFGKTTVATKDFDLTKFTKVSAEATSMIQINHPLSQVELLTSHSKDSYEIKKDGENASVLQIKDAKEFWKKAKCLVILLN